MPVFVAAAAAVAYAFAATVADVPYAVVRHRAVIFLGLSNVLVDLFVLALDFVVAWGLTVVAVSQRKLMASLSLDLQQLEQHLVADVAFACVADFVWPVNASVHCPHDWDRYDFEPAASAVTSLLYLAVVSVPAYFDLYGDQFPFAAAEIVDEQQLELVVAVAAHFLLQLLHLHCFE